MLGVWIERRATFWAEFCKWRYRVAIEASEIGIGAWNASCGIEDRCWKQVENQEPCRYLTSFVPRRIHATAVERGQHEKSSPCVSDKNIESATHPDRTAPQCGAPEVLLFEVSGKPVSHEYHGQENQEDARTEKFDG